MAECCEYILCCLGRDVWDDVTGRPVVLLALKGPGRLSKRFGAVQLDRKLRSCCRQARYDEMSVSIDGRLWKEMVWRSLDPSGNKDD